MSKQRIRIPKKKVCASCLAIATYRECPDCGKGKCILCICKCKPIKNSLTNNNKPVTKAIMKSKKRSVK